MKSYTEFYTTLIANTKDLPLLYEKIAAWLKEIIDTKTLIFYQPDPLEDLAMDREKMALPVVLHGKENPDAIDAGQIRHNESGLLDLDNHLIHLTIKKRWLGAIEIDVDLPAEIKKQLELITALLDQAVDYQQENMQATVSRWFQNISESLNSTDSYPDILNYLIRESCRVVEANSGGYYTPAGNDYRLEVAYGFEPEVERDKKTITNERLMELDFNRKELVVEIPSKQEEFHNIYIPIQALRRRAGLLAIYNWQSDRKLSQKKRYLLTMLSELGHFALCQYEVHSQQTKIIEDGITGLKTETYFKQRLNQEIERGKRYNCASALLLLDIDNFSDLNNTYGHSAGDAILREFGRLIKNCFRTVDISSRFSNDRFGILFVNTSLEDAMIAAKRFHSLVEKPIFKVEGKFIEVNISGGITGYPEDAEESDQLLKQAQLALYKAKKTGRNKIISSSDL